MMATDRIISRHIQANPKASAWLMIDRAALAENYRIFCDKVGASCAVTGVIKADAYGLGADQVMATLENAACPFYYVATLEEALHVRKLTEKPVAVFGGLFHGGEADYIHEAIIPVLNSLEEIVRWQALAAQHGISLPAIVHFDTAMNRLGLGADEAALLAENPQLTDGLNILYAMSHFASADEADSPLSETQATRFDETVKAALPWARKSLANSAGLFRSPRFHLDQVRPGMALYGLNPVPGQDNPMRPVVSLHARILQVRNVKKGDSAGYGETYRFEKDGRTATVALGYADGFLRSLSNRGKLYYNGMPCPIRGRVSMDAVIVDVSDIADGPLPGEIMEVIGPHQDADTIAADAGTIGYEILTDLGRRYHRTYL